MNGQVFLDECQLGNKIARLVQERGWNQEEFARIAGLNRQTVRQLFRPGGCQRRLRNATVAACAHSLGLSVSELRTTPVEQLLHGMQGSGANGAKLVRQLYEQATQPELIAWLQRNPGRADQLTNDDVDELLSLQGTGGPLTEVGVEHFVGLIERKNRLLEKVHAIAGTEYLDLLEQVVALVFDKIRPYAERES